MQTGGGNQGVQSRANGAVATNGNGRLEPGALSDQALVARWTASASEADQSESEVVPALKIGEQRYPDPTVWAPETDEPLMQDDRYREALAFLRRLEERQPG